MCYPFKVTLGSFIEGLEIAKEKGIRLTYFGVGASNACTASCRFQQYFELQKNICEDLGYDFDTHFIERRGKGKIGGILGVIATLKELDPRNSYLKTIRELKRIIRKMTEEEKKRNRFDWSDEERIRIGVVGEYYTVVEDSINHDIFNKLRELGANVHTFVTYSNELRKAYKEEVPVRFIKEAKQYYDGVFRGHGDSSFYSLYFYRHYNFDGVIHLLPLSCMPESTAEMMMDLAAKKLRLPLYRFEIDETNSEANINTRLEAFVELLEENKGKRKRV
jgi:predicted nucleotide-binding protein (sugar kinase/HSP70/actin superfamily)